MSSVFGKKFKSISDFQTASSLSPASQIVELPCSSIFCLEQVRGDDSEAFSTESLSELANSMKIDGQIEPVIVRPHPDQIGSYLMVAGERRYKAAELSNLPLKAIILDLDDETVRRIQIAENIHRQNLTQKEIAAAVIEDKKRLGTLEAVSKEWKKSVNWVSQMIKYHEALANPDSLAAQLIEENITADVTAITDLEKLGKVDLEAAKSALDELRTDPGSNIRDTIKSKLKEVKEDRKSKKKVTKNESAPSSDDTTAAFSKALEINCSTLDKLFKMASAALCITGLCVYGSSEIITKIIISVKNSPDSKVSQDLTFHAKDYPIATAFTALFTKLPASKLAQNFASHIYIK